MEKLTVEELEKVYTSAVNDYRYYVNTDDSLNWEREREARQAARKHLDKIQDEYKRRGLPLPRVP